MRICPHCETLHLYDDEEGIERCFKCGHWHDPTTTPSIEQLRLDCEQMQLQERYRTGQVNWDDEEDAREYFREWRRNHREQVNEKNRQYYHNVTKKKAGLKNPAPSLSAA